MVACFGVFVGSWRVFFGCFFVYCSLVGIHETRRRGVAIPGFGLSRRYSAPNLDLSLVKDLRVRVRVIFSISSSKSSSKKNLIQTHQLSQQLQLIAEVICS